MYLIALFFSFALNSGIETNKFICQQKLLEGKTDTVNILSQCNLHSRKKNRSFYKVKVSHIDDINKRSSSKKIRNFVL